MKLARRFAPLFLILLAACAVVPQIDPNPNTELKFEICDRALKRPVANRAFQGLDGWFYFDYDLEETLPIFEQTEFMAELSRRLATQDVTLLAMPISSRALVRPDTLYLDDPYQASFGPEEANAVYQTFVLTLKEEGVEVFDVVEAAKAFDRGGGQTFFRRDLHWNAEGANALFKGVAAQIEKMTGNTLPQTKLILTRRPEDDQHRGQFVSNWTYSQCGYVLPAEPQGVYTLSKPDPEGGLFGGGAPEVVLAGSSFSRPPYDYDFLAAALQSEVLNVSVGAGGAYIGLQSYLLDGAYQTDKPRVLVWEFPTFADPIPEGAQREILGSVYGSCAAPETRFSDASTARGVPLARLADGTGVSAAEHYLELNFDDLGVLNFDVTLTYADGTEETLALERSTLTPNKGQYFLSLKNEPGAVLTGVTLGLPGGVSGGVSAQLCDVPG